MDRVLSIILWISIVVSIITAGFWIVTLYHILRTLMRVPSLQAGLGFDGADKAAAPSERGCEVCVIVPAHNEERVIGTITAALLAQDCKGLRVVFALDRCTDRTEAIIRAAIMERPDAADRFEILKIEHCPDEWVGKVHALHVATTTSSAARLAPLLLFLDADTIPEPSCVRAAVGLMRTRGDDLLSVLSTLTSDRWFERVVQPVAGMELLRQYPMVRANHAKEPRPFANGQFILVKREAYEAIGGHAAVRSEVLEDVWLARMFARGGRRCGFYFSGDLLRCRMYEAWERFRRGWLRIYGECASRKAGRLRRASIIVRLLYCVFPAASMVCVVACVASGVLLPAMGVRIEGAPDWAMGAAAGTAGTVAWLGVMSLVYRLGRTPIWAVPASIVGGWLVAGLLLEAARNYEKGRPVVWGGREYRREQR